MLCFHLGVFHGFQSKFSPFIRVDITRYRREFRPECQKKFDRGHRVSLPCDQAQFNYNLLR